MLSVLVVLGKPLVFLSFKYFLDPAIQPFPLGIGIFAETWDRGSQLLPTCLFAEQSAVVSR